LNKKTFRLPRGNLKVLNKNPSFSLHAKEPATVSCRCA